MFGHTLTDEVIEFAGEFEACRERGWRDPRRRRQGRGGARGALRMRWTWEVPAGWNLEPQFSNTVDAGTPGGVAVAAFIGLIPPANAPKRIAAPPGPLRPTRIDNVYGLEAGGDMGVLDGLTGRVRWDLTGVAGSVLPVGGTGSICVVTDAGIDCRRAADGSPQWATTWVAKNASQQWPALGCMSLAGGAQPCVIAAGAPLRRVADGFHSRIPTAAWPTESAADLRVDLTSIGHGQGHDPTSAPCIRRFSIQHRHLAGVTSWRPCCG
jgi:hypothetical protein